MLIFLAVGEFGSKDTSIQVTGLKPGHYYNIRVIATNSANFSTLSPLVRLRTAQTRGKYGEELLSGKDDATVDAVEEREPAGIRAGRSQFGAPAQAPAHHVAKDISTLQSSTKRTMLGRRVSPVITTVESPSLVSSSRTTSVDEDDSDEAIQRLTEQLNRLRRDQHETDRQVDEEEQEHLASVADLSRDRGHLRQILKEKEESTAELKKHGGHLEKINRAAQNRKLNKERVLAQKKTERDKVSNDVARWEDEMSSMRRESEQLALEQKRIGSTNDEDIIAIRKVIASDHEQIKFLEDEIRMTGVQIKSMEKDREYIEGNENEGRHDPPETSDDNAWELRAQAMHAQLTTLWHTLQQVSARGWVPACVAALTDSRWRRRTTRHRNVWDTGMLGGREILAILLLCRPSTILLQVDLQELGDSDNPATIDPMRLLFPPTDTQVHF